MKSNYFTYHMFHHIQAGIENFKVGGRGQQLFQPRISIFLIIPLVHNLPFFGLIQVPIYAKPKMILFINIYPKLVLFPYKQSQLSILRGKKLKNIFGQPLLRKLLSEEKNIKRYLGLGQNKTYFNKIWVKTVMI